MEMSFTGVPALVRRMEDIRARMVKEQATKAVRAGAQIIAKAMVQSAPVLDVKTSGSNSLEPGELKADIKARVFTEDGEVFALAGPGEGTAYAARFVEYGHRMVVGGPKTMRSDGKMRRSRASMIYGKDIPAHPFLRPAYEASVQEAIETRDAILAEGLKG